MEVVARTSCPVRIGFLAALLRDAGIEAIILDQHIAAIEGGIGAFPRRLAVRADDASRARRLLRDAGEAAG